VSAVVREGRHLAAIMFMDMVGYSLRMQENEQRAIAAVRGLWDLVRPILAQHGGREVDLAGDGMLMEFPGALAAVRCGVDVHAALQAQNRQRPETERLRVRAGVHLGDIEHRDGRIYGDGVNIAARVIAQAPPGAVAMTPHVRDQLMNALEQPVQRLGLRALKNIKAPLELWCVAGPECTGAELAAAQGDDEGADRKWTFGNCVFNERTLELTVDGAPVSLDKNSLDVLLHLLRHADEVVTREELLETLGRGTADAELAACIITLRRTLVDEAGALIRAVHGFGYRLAVPVKVETTAAEAAPHFEFHAGTRPPHRPQWSLVERLGSGGHGEAWLGQHDKTRELRVFKFALEASALASLKREITLYRVLNDSLGARSDYVRVLDWNVDQAPYFIESEHANRGNLAQWAQDIGGLQALPLPERLALVATVADALAAAHSVGVLHKDLKPANVLVHEARDGRQIKLCDFGSGGVLDPRRLENLGITRMGFTRTILDIGTDSTSGTPLYLAPEVLAGQPFTVQADIFALGVILYQVVVGDFRRGLAPGWEAEVADELLREDIAAAAAGNPARRLPDPSLLATRLRTLEQRRTERQHQLERARQADQLKLRLQRSRLRDRVALLVGAVLLLAAFPIAKYYSAAMQARRDAEAVSVFVSDELLSMADPNIARTPDLTFKSVIERAGLLVDEKLAGQPAAAARVHLALANSMSWLDMGDEALAHLQRAAALREQMYGRRSEPTQEVLPALVTQLRSKGRHEEAAALSNEVVQFAIERWGPDDARTLEVQYQMAVEQRSMGHINEPLAALRAVIETATRVLPEQARNPWWYFQYGIALSAAAEYAEAEKVFQRAIDLQGRKNGPAHYATAWAERGHAGTLRSLGRLEEAEREARQAHEKMAQWRGPENTQTIVFHAGIGEIMLEAGRLPEALAMLEADYARCHVHSCDISEAASLYQNLGQARILSGKAAAAIPVLEELERRVAGESSWINRRLATARAVLAEAHLASGNVPGAQAALDAIPGRAISTLPPKHPFLASVRRVEGLLWLRKGELDRARTALAEAEDICRLRFGREHWRTLRAREELRHAEGKTKGAARGGVAAPSPAHPTDARATAAR
jgi:eukaryotic-like serine/threonine-protein kinase